jgi:hypothetical protein
MARVLAKAILARGPDAVGPMASKLAQAIEACHAGDKAALHKVLAKAMHAAEHGTPF